VSGGIRETVNSEEVSFGSGEDRTVVQPRFAWSYRLTVTQPIYAGARERGFYPIIDRAYARLLDAAMAHRLVAVGFRQDAPWR